MFYASKQATQRNFVSSSCGVCKQDRVVIEMICVCTFVKENEVETRWMALCKMQSFLCLKKECGECIIYYSRVLLPERML